MTSGAVSRGRTEPRGGSWATPETPETPTPLVQTAGIKSQGEWIRNIVNTDGCTGCHQLGNKATREIPKSLGTFAKSVDAWDRRVQSGQAGGAMSARITQVGRERALAMFADWTDRVARGETPSVAPPRPPGKERNVVVTNGDWAGPK